MTESFYAKRYDSIQALRGIAAFSVVLHHISFVENGSFGVDIFFCISGFIMMYVTHINTNNFILKRLIRIVPLYYCITLLTFASMHIFPFLFESKLAGVSSLIKSLLFIPCRLSGAIQPVVRVGWTLNYEVFFYVILWLSMKISVRYRGFIASCILIILACLGNLFDYRGTILPFYTNSIVVEFVFGIVAYEILKRIRYEKKGLNAGGIFMLIGAVMCYAFMFSVKYIDALSGWDRVIVYGIPAFILFLCAFIALYNVKIPRVFVFLGDISYSVYLVHYFIARLYDRILDTYGYDNVMLRCAAILVFVLAAAVGGASYYLFEVKLNNRLRRCLINGR